MRIFAQRCFLASIHEFFVVCRLIVLRRYDVDLARESMTLGTSIHIELYRCVSRSTSRVKINRSRKSPVYSLPNDHWQLFVDRKLRVFLGLDLSVKAKAVADKAEEKYEALYLG
jgi:predicted ATPase